MRYPPGFPPQLQNIPTHPYYDYADPSTPRPRMTTFAGMEEDAKTPTRASFRLSLPNGDVYDCAGPSFSPPPAVTLGETVSTADIAIISTKVLGVAGPLTGALWCFHRLSQQALTNHSPVRLVEKQLARLNEVKDHIAELEKSLAPLRAEGSAIPTDLTDGEPGPRSKPISTHDELVAEYERLVIRTKTQLGRLKQTKWTSWSLASSTDEAMVNARNLAYAVEALEMSTTTTSTTYYRWLDARNTELERHNDEVRLQIEQEHCAKIAASMADIDIVLPPGPPIPQL